MPPRHTTIAQKNVTRSVARQGRISKTKARDMIRSATNPYVYPFSGLNDSTHAATPRASPVESDSIDRLSNILQSGFERMGTEIRQATISAFDQLMERLDGVDGPSASVSAPRMPVMSGSVPIIRAVSPVIG